MEVVPVSGVSFHRSTLVDRGFESNFLVWKLFIRPFVLIQDLKLEYNAGKKK